ncbi:MAG: phosphate acyltransferase [Ilumatobacteraceae bacterium]
MSGVILSGGLRPDARVSALIDGMSGGVPIPLLSVETDSFDTAIAAGSVEGAITPGDRRKVDVALAHLEAHVDLARLAERIEIGRSDVVTPIMFEYDLIERAKAAKAHIVLPEGTDDRVLRAAERIRRRQVCDLTLLGPVAAVTNRIAELGCRSTCRSSTLDPS